jgi:hypothetical protein
MPVKVSAPANPAKSGKSTKVTKPNALNDRYADTVKALQVAGRLVTGADYSKLSTSTTLARHFTEVIYSAITSIEKSSGIVVFDPEKFNRHNSKPTRSSKKESDVVVVPGQADDVDDVEAEEDGDAEDAEAEEADGDAEEANGDAEEDADAVEDDDDAEAEADAEANGTNGTDKSEEKKSKSTIVTLTFDARVTLATIINRVSAECASVFHHAKKEIPDKDVIAEVVRRADTVASYKGKSLCKIVFPTAMRLGDSIHNIERSALSRTVSGIIQHIKFSSSRQTLVANVLVNYLTLLAMAIAETCIIKGRQNIKGRDLRCIAANLTIGNSAFIADLGIPVIFGSWVAYGAFNELSDIVLVLAPPPPPKVLSKEEQAIRDAKRAESAEKKKKAAEARKAAKNETPKVTSTDVEAEIEEAKPKKGNKGGKAESGKAESAAPAAPATPAAAPAEKPKRVK